MEKEITLTSVSGENATFTLRNTMRADARYRVWEDRFANGRPDEVDRANFAWFWSRVVKWSGIKVATITETATEDEFNAVFWGFGDHFTTAVLVTACQAVNEMKGAIADNVEKPDDALTPVEEADPN
jgi:hypothetical protein